MSEIYPTYIVEVKQVISGDDILVMAELSPDDIYKKVRCRLEGVDTPDGYRQDKDSPAGKVRELVRKLVKNQKCSVIVKNQSRKDWIVEMFIHDGDKKLNLNAYLISEGYVYSQDNSDVQKAKTTT